MARLKRAFYRREADVVARALLGQTLVHVVDGQRVAGKIVETEAYMGVEDKACHAYAGRRTRRSETMYGDGGTSYVFLNYGIHFLFNVVVAKRDDPHAVLIRALEPTEGLDRMRKNRPAAKREQDLCSGPGKLGAALAINLEQDAVDLVESESLFIERAETSLSPSSVVVCPRVGIDYAEEWAVAPLRFYLEDNSHVSRSATQ